MRQRPGVVERVVHKVHKKKRTVTEEEEDIPELDSINVSYLTNSHSVSPDSTVGMLIVNFLVHTRSPVNTNVVTYSPSGEFYSLYNFDLRASLAELEIGEPIVIARSGFENDADAALGIESLAGYLGTMNKRSMPHQDQVLLEDALGYLSSRRTVVSRKSAPSVTLERGVVRESVGGSVPVVRPEPAPRSILRRTSSPRLAPRATRKIRKSVTYEESSTTTTEEEEVVVVRR